MKQMVCSVCSYTYDEAKGIPEAGIAPGTKWEELSEDWKCPWCGAGKDAFREKTEKPETPSASARSPITLRLKSVLWLANPRLLRLSQRWPRTRA